MSETDEQMNRAIRHVAGREIVQSDEAEETDEIDRHFRVDQMSQSERRLYDQWRRGPGMKTDADVNAFIRRQAGRAT